MCSLYKKVFLVPFLFLPIYLHAVKTTWEIEPYEQAEFQVGPYGGLQMQIEPEIEMQNGEEGDVLLW